MAPDRPGGRTDPRSYRRLAPPALTPGRRRKRPPGPLAVRRRYRLARWASVAVGGLAAAVVIAAALADLTARELLPHPGFYALTPLGLAGGLGAPRVRVPGP